jgi:hypothetical protein
MNFGVRRHVAAFQSLPPRVRPVADADMSVHSEFERRRFVVSGRMRCAQNRPLPFNKGERIEVRGFGTAALSDTRTLTLALSLEKGEARSAQIAEIAER